MALRKSTKIWLGVFAAGLLGISLDQLGSGDRLGPAAIPFWLACLAAAAVLGLRASLAAFRAIIHGLTLRLAFSYFLIGIVPIPLIALSLLIAGYITVSQIIGTQVLREAEGFAEAANPSSRGVAVAKISGGKVAESSAAWLPVGTPAGWAEELEVPRVILVGKDVWMAHASNERGGLRVLLVPIDQERLESIAKRTRTLVRLEAGTSRTRRARVDVGRKDPDIDIDVGGARGSGTWIRPPGPEPKSGHLLDAEWVAGFRIERAVASFQPEVKSPVAVFLARTSPRAFVRQLFRQGAAEVSGVLLAVIGAVVAALFFVYLVALVIAFVLVGSIARNVNKLTRAAQAIGRGDLSVRVNSRSRDQIGDLARSFDAMAASIQRLLVETARKEKLEAELSVARAIQRSLLPESGGSWPGFRVAAHFEPVAEVGGDFYDILPMTDGRTAVVVGDASGHGLPTGLLAAAAKASLTTFIELGLSGPEIFAKLAERAARVPRRRTYMTLSMLEYDAVRRIGTLTNAGHPAPYRISGGRVERLALPAAPIGLLPQRAFPSREFSFAPGDRLVLFTDGVVEAADGAGDPFGFERLEALLEKEASKAAEDLLGVVLAAVAVHVGGAELEDDRTLLLLAFE